MGVSKNNGTAKSSTFSKYGFPLFSPSILGVAPLFLENSLFQSQETIKTIRV